MGLPTQCDPQGPYSQVLVHGPRVLTFPPLFKRKGSFVRQGTLLCRRSFWSEMIPLRRGGRSPMSWVHFTCALIRSDGKLRSWSSYFKIYLVLFPFWPGSGTSVVFLMVWSRSHWSTRTLQGFKLRSSSF